MSDKPLPYAQWNRHVADSGLVYLSHPTTGAVKWLWSRHRDPSTGRDYLVNTVSSERHWVTPANEHLCPAPAAAKVYMPRAPERVAKKKPSAQSSRGNFREIAAPKSLGLGPDEALMLVSDTGRRYVYNKKTKVSRWLPQRPPDTISSSSKRGVASRAALSNDDATRISEPPSASATPAPNLAGQLPPKHGAPELRGSVPVTHLPKGEERSIGAQRRVATPAFATASAPRHAKMTAAPAASPVPMRVLTCSPEEATMRIQRVCRGFVTRRANLLSKLAGLTTVLRDVRGVTAEGKYDMKYLRAVADSKKPSADAADAAQRLLELGEYLTQKMLKVDAVESAGNPLVRAKRKESVKMILALTDEIDSLRTLLKQQMKL